MPGKAGRKPRGSVQLCNLIDRFGAQRRRRARIARESRMDGIVTPEENRVIEIEEQKEDEIYQQIQTHASQQDLVMQMLALWSTTGRLTEHGERQLGYAVADEARLMGVAA